MIRKIKDSLFLKVFIITALLMLSVGMSVYGILAVFMPQTYSNELNSVLDSQAQTFVLELGQVSMKKSGGLFDRFQQNANIEYVELYDDNGQQIALPSNYKKEDTVEMVMETASETSDNAPVLSNNYYFSFIDKDTKYTLAVYGSAAQIEELEKTFIRIFPIVLAVVIMESLFTSGLFSRLITKPVLKISSISKEMSELNLNWDIDVRRTDELGILEQSLNDLSHKLSSTLSELKCANEQLKRDIEHERELEQAQMEFFSAVSHELKTPITVIKGQLEGMVLGIGAYKDHEKYLARSLDVTNTLENMVQELLTISRLKGTNTVFKIEEFDCIPIIQAFLRETEDLIVDKNIRVVLDIPESVIIKGNRLMLGKVYSNLIGNAIKYSQKGATVDISIHRQGEEYLFCIENSGTHIPDEKLSKIFDAFYRVEQSRNRKTGGSGLGLYIVQTILQQHGSCCLVCNTENGVRFSFVI